MDDLKQTKIYWQEKEEELQSTMWITSFVGCSGPVVRQTR